MCVCECKHTTYIQSGELISKTHRRNIGARAYTHAEWCVSDRKKDGKPIFKRLKRGLRVATPSALRLVEHWQRKRVRVRDENVYTQHTRTSHPHSYSYSYSYALDSDSNFYDVRVFLFRFGIFLSFLCLWFTFLCAVFARFLFESVNFFFAFSSLFFCLYNMINVYVYVVVRSPSVSI